MKIIAIEEAFAVAGMGLSDADTKKPTPITPEILAEWKERLEDFTERRIPDMDANGVSLQVLSLTTPGIQGASGREEAVENAKKANNFLAATIAKSPKRFRGFAALPLQDPAAAATELHRCIRQLCFCGALINDHTNGHYMDEEQFGPVWEALEALDVPLYIHPGAPKADHWNVLNGYPQVSGAAWGWGAEVGGHAIRIIFGGVFDRHPKARLILGHMGEFLPFQLWRLDSRYKTFKEQPLQLPPSEYFKRHISITTSGVCSPDALLGAIGAIGENNVMFAIDYPYESSSIAVEFLKSAPLSDTTREKIAWKNAERILKIR